MVCDDAEPADEHVEGGIYISPEFQLGQVYDGAADVVEDVILYRPVYVCAPRPPGSDIGNGHSPSVRGVDHTPSPSPVAGSPAAAGRPRVGGVSPAGGVMSSSVGGVSPTVGGVSNGIGGVTEAKGGLSSLVGGVSPPVGGVSNGVGGVSPAGSVEHINAHSSPSHGRSAVTRTKKVESTTTTTTTTVDGRSNEHHHQHRHHYHHPPHQQQKEELSEPPQQYRSSHEVIVHDSAPSDRGGRDPDPAKPTVTAAAVGKEVATRHDGVRLTDRIDSAEGEGGAEAAERGAAQDGVVGGRELATSTTTTHIRTTTTTTKTTTTTSATTTTTAGHQDAPLADATVIKYHIAASPPLPPPSSPAVMTSSPPSVTASTPAVTAPSSSVEDCNSTNLATTADHCADVVVVATAEREPVKPVCQQTPTN